MTTETSTQTDPTPEQLEAAFEREDREAERIAESEAADAERSQPGVGFVGCKSSGGLLRVRVANRNRQRMRVACPHGCGEHETSKSMARALRDEEAEPELIELPPLERPPDARKGDTGSARRKVSDAAIFDAIPVGDEVVAGEVSETLGYAGGGRAGGLMTRLRRMNSRSEKEGMPPPFTFTRRKLGAGGPNIVIGRTAEVSSNDG